MNKTVNINLAGIFFHIDEDAYLKLQRYLEAIKRSFTDSQGRSEIISDIEARIAELFSERIQNEKQVVGIKLVDEVITIMGQPEDYLVDDEIFDDEPQPKQRQSSRSSKKLYRDTDNSYIGGVAAGLSHYLGIESIWVRLIWLLFAIGSGGTFIFIYLIFWALVPEAKTTAEKLTMSGDAVNISNIEKKIKDGIDTVSENVGVTNAVHFPPMDFLEVANAANIPMWLMSTLVFFAFSIPFFFVFYSGLKILVNNLKSIGNIAKFTLLGLWTMAIIGLVITGVKQATEHAFDAKVTAKKELNIKATDTLKISMTDFEGYDDYFYRYNNSFRIIEGDNGRNIVSKDINLLVKSTKDSMASIIIEKEASGSNFTIARERAEKKCE